MRTAISTKYHYYHLQNYHHLLFVMKVAHQTNQKSKDAKRDIKRERNYQRNCQYLFQNNYLQKASLGEYSSVPGGIFVQTYKTEQAIKINKQRKLTIKEKIKERVKKQYTHFVASTSRPKQPQNNFLKCKYLENHPIAIPIARNINILGRSYSKCAEMEVKLPPKTPFQNRPLTCRTTAEDTKTIFKRERKKRRLWSSLKDYGDRGGNKKKQERGLSFGELKFSSKIDAWEHEDAKECPEEEF